MFGSLSYFWFWITQLWEETTIENTAKQWKSLAPLLEKRRCSASKPVNIFNTKHFRITWQMRIYIIGMKVLRCRKNCHYFRFQFQSTFWHYFIFTMLHFANILTFSWFHSIRLQSQKSFALTSIAYMQFPPNRLV